MGAEHYIRLTNMEKMYILATICAARIEEDSWDSDSDSEIDDTM